MLPTLTVRIHREGNHRARVLSPAVGWWIVPQGTEQRVGPGGVVGQLHCLNRRFDLLMPQGLAGRVVRSEDRRIVAVDYGQTLFHLDLSATAEDVSASTAETNRTHDSAAEGWIVAAPTDGVFYRRPAPGQPPFVEVGSRVRIGQPVGLVEVMKTFNQIVFSGPGFPEEAEVREIRHEDGDEVRVGQPLLVFG